MAKPSKTPDGKGKEHSNSNSAGCKMSRTLKRFVIDQSQVGTKALKDDCENNRGVIYQKAFTIQTFSSQMEGRKVLPPIYNTVFAAIEKSLPLMNPNVQKRIDYVLKEALGNMYDSGVYKNFRNFGAGILDITITVSKFERDKRKYLGFSFRDNGSGISMPSTEFKNAHPGMFIGGLGLGLKNMQKSVGDFSKLIRTVNGAVYYIAIPY